MTMRDIDLSLSDPTEIVHAVCDVAAGRRVRMTWSSNGDEMAFPSLDAPALLGVRSEVVEVVGCVVVKPNDPPVVACELLAEDEFFVVAWRDVLRLECAEIGGAPSPVRDRVVEVSRWFGHNMEFTLRDGDRFVGDVTGVEYVGSEVEVLVRPTDHVRVFRHPQPGRLRQRQRVLDPRVADRRPGSTGESTDRPRSRNRSVFGPQLQLHSPAQQLVEQLVVAGSGCVTQRVRQCRPLAWSAAGVARPAAAADSVGHVLRLRSDREVVGPNATPDVAAVADHWFLEHAAVGDHRPAVRSDDTERVAAEPV